ncbi:hypothetical protein [Brevundimonas halotolerans]|uniref:Transposase IS200-like domain-containing protein n=1 Tax=Brevundimonas halotolerans TaxID=69670 RepID=A0A7W9A464_9CAUL|nr:hypothetical protein [Brevundimonas halotolerans]MBB5661096.1 hypothetical protein [Brevundimonas halotolerans]
MIPLAVKTLEYRSSITELVEQLNPALAITLAFNRDTTPDCAARDLRHLHARLDRMTLGPGWAKRVDHRTKYVAVIEHVDTNLHIHLALSCAPQFVEQIASAVAGIWKDMIPAGSVVVKAITDAPGWGRYISKAITPHTSALLLLP